MPFGQLIPRPLTGAAVVTYAPSASGVYGMSNSSQWIFIGETDDIQAALLKHLREPDAREMKSKPTGFVFELCGREARLARQNRLVHEYGPICNRLSAGPKPRSRP